VRARAGPSFKQILHKSRPSPPRSRPPATSATGASLAQRPLDSGRLLVSICQKAFPNARVPSLPRKTFPDPQWRAKVARRYAIVEAASALGHVPEHRGVERAPGVLLGFGLADGLEARRAGRVAAEGYSPVRDPETGITKPRALRSYSSVLADAVTEVLDAGEFPIVLGGDCSIVLGAMLALRRRGRYGLLYIDGDADFYQPEANPLDGAAASASDLAFATGRGPDVVCDLEQRRPLVRDDPAGRRAFSSRSTTPTSTPTAPMAAPWPPRSTTPSAPNLGTRASISRRCRSGGSPGSRRRCGPGSARGGRGPRGRTGGCRCRTARARA
jgi:arginase family protein